MDWVYVFFVVVFGLLTLLLTYPWGEGFFQKEISNDPNLPDKPWYMRDWTTGFGASLFASLIFCGILPFLAGLLIDELGWMLLLGVPLVWLYRRLTTGRWQVAEVDRVLGLF